MDLVEQLPVLGGGEHPRFGPRGPLQRVHDGGELDGLGAGADDDQDALLRRHGRACLSDRGPWITHEACAAIVVGAGPAGRAGVAAAARRYVEAWGGGSISTVVGSPSMLNTCIEVVAVKRTTLGVWCSRSISPLSCSVSSMGESA